MHQRERVAAGLDHAAHAADGQRERRALQGRTGADLRECGPPRNQPARGDGELGGLGGGPETIARGQDLGGLVRSLTRQLQGLAPQHVPPYIVPHVFQGRDDRLLAADDRDERRPGGSLNRPRDGALLHLEGLRRDPRSEPETQNRLARRDESGLLQLEAPGRRGAFQILGGRGLRRNRAAERRGPGGGLLVLQRVLDGLADVLERLRGRFLLLGHADDVKAERAADGVGDGVDVEPEGGSLDLGHHAAAPEHAEIATLGRGRVVLRMLARQLREVGPGARLVRQLAGPGLHVALLLALDAQEDVAGAHLPRRRVLGDVGVVVLLDLRVGGREGLEDRGLVDEEEPELPLLRFLVRQGRFVVQRLDLLVRHLHLVPVVVAAEGDELDPHLLVAPAVLRGDLLVRDGDPTGDGRFQPLEQDVAAHLFLELGGGQRGALERQRLPVALLADEPSVLLKTRQAHDALAHLGVAHRQSEPLGFRQGRVAADERLQDLAIDPQRAQHLLGDLAGRLQAVALQLGQIELAEPRHRDLVVADPREDIVRHALEGRLIDESRDVQEHERKADQGQAPLEPSLVAPHAVEHRHAADCSRRARILPSVPAAAGAVQPGARSGPGAAPWVCYICAQGFRAFKIESVRPEGIVRLEYSLDLFLVLERPRDRPGNREHVRFRPGQGDRAQRAVDRGLQQVHGIDRGRRPRREGDGGAHAG